MSNAVDDAWCTLLTVWDEEPEGRNELPERWRDWLIRMTIAVSDMGDAFDRLPYDDAELRAVEKRLTAQIQGITSALNKVRVSPFMPPPDGNDRRDARDNSGVAPTDTPPRPIQRLA